MIFAAVVVVAFATFLACCVGMLVSGLGRFYKKRHQRSRHEYGRVYAMSTDFRVALCDRNGFEEAILKFGRRDVAYDFAKHVVGHPFPCVRVGIVGCEYSFQYFNEYYRGGKPLHCACRMV